MNNDPMINDLYVNDEPMIIIRVKMRVRVRHFNIRSCHEIIGSWSLYTQAAWYAVLFVKHGYWVPVVFHQNVHLLQTVKSHIRREIHAFVVYLILTPRLKSHAFTSIAVIFFPVSSVIFHYYHTW